MVAGVASQPLQHQPHLHCSCSSKVLSLSLGQPMIRAEEGEHWCGDTAHTAALRKLFKRIRFLSTFHIHFERISLCKNRQINSESCQVTQRPYIVKSILSRHLILKKMKTVFEMTGQENLAFLSLCWISCPSASCTQRTLSPAHIFLPCFICCIGKEVKPAWSKRQQHKKTMRRDKSIGRGKTKCDSTAVNKETPFKLDIIHAVCIWALPNRSQ